MHEPDDGYEAVDEEQLWAPLRPESREVKTSLMQTAILVASTWGEMVEDEINILSAIADEFGFDQAAVDALAPEGEVVLSAFAVTPATAPEARRAWLAILIHLAVARGRVHAHALEVIGHTGEKLGFADDETARLITETLGIEAPETAGEA